MSKKLVKIILIVVGIFVVAPILVVAAVYFLIAFPYIRRDHYLVTRPFINSCFSISREGLKVYAVKFPGDLPEYYEMKNADPKTFKPLGDSCYAADDHQAYFETEILSEASTTDLHLIEADWIRDNNRSYATDGSTVYYKNQRVEGIDAKTVRYFKFGYYEYLVDNTSFFYHGQNMGQVDPKTLAVYREGFSYIKDKNGVYYVPTVNPLKLVKLEGVKPSTELVLEGTSWEYARMGNKMYHEGVLIQ